MAGRFDWQSPSSRLVLTAALDLLAERGYEGLTVQELRSRSGLAEPALDDDLDLDALMIVALEHVRVLAAPPPTGSLEGDLQALLEHWRVPRTRDELVLTAVLSAAEWNPHLKQAVAETLDRQVAQAVGAVLGRVLTGGAALSRIQTLGWVLRGLMLERLRTGPRSDADLHALVTFLLHGLDDQGGSAHGTSSDAGSGDGARR